MMSDAEIWKLITDPETSSIPGWIRQMAAANLTGLSKNGNFRSEEKILDPSYLQFLDQQIALEPRGPEWMEVLKKRRNALSPYIGKAIITVAVVEDNRMATIRINPEQGKIFDIEEN